MLDDICTLELHGFNEQNVISGLQLNKHDEGYEVVLGACYGVEGRIVAKQVRIGFEAGIPPLSIYN